MCQSIVASSYASRLGSNVIALKGTIHPMVWRSIIYLNMIHLLIIDNVLWLNAFICHSTQCHDKCLAAHVKYCFGMNF